MQDHKRSGGVLRPILLELRHNASTSAITLWMDVSTLAACAAMFFLFHNALIGMISSSYPNSVGAHLAQCHAIDAIGGCAFMAYTNLLLDLVKPAARFKRLLPTLAYMLLCGAFWEVAAPLFVPNSIGDVLDLVAYLLGACCYLTIAKMALRKKETRLE